MPILKFIPILPESSSLNSVLSFLPFSFYGASLLPYYWDVAGLAYMRFTVIISSLYLALAIVGIMKKIALKLGMKDDSSWGRCYYWASLIYLPLLFLGVVFLN